MKKGFKSFKGYVKHLLKVHDFDNYGDLIEHITNGDAELFNSKKAKKDFNLYCENNNYIKNEVLEDLGILKLIQKNFYW